MGLDFNHSDAHWSYSGFNEFREELCKSIGIDWNNMDGIGGKNISWATVNDAIKPLLNHSDCDGELTVAEMKQVSPRLREIVRNWPDDYDKEQALILCDDMDNCIKHNQILEFY